jgi:hypothetical protein
LVRHVWSFEIQRRRSRTVARSLRWPYAVIAGNSLRGTT